MEIRTNEKYSESFKIHVVSEVESGKLSKCAANRKYGILGHSTILKWCRKYGHFHTNGHKRVLQGLLSMSILSKKFGT